MGRFIPSRPLVETLNYEVRKFSGLSQQRTGQWTAHLCPKRFFPLRILKDVPGNRDGEDLCSQDQEGYVTATRPYQSLMPYRAKDEK